MLSFLWNLLIFYDSIFFSFISTKYKITFIKIVRVKILKNSKIIDSLLFRVYYLNSKLFKYDIKQIQ